MDWYPTPFNQTVMFVTICIAAPIIEELFFRGVLFRSMKRFGPWTAAVLSSLIFALLHSNPVQAIFIFLVAMVLCWAYNASDSVIVPIILHALNNIISFFDLGMPAIVLIVLGLGGLILIAYHCRKFRMPDFSLLKTPSMIVLIVFLVIVMVSGLAL
jgi:membrane protease YdiL (CAAX protease family)